MWLWGGLFPTVSDIEGKLESFFCFGGLGRSPAPPGPSPPVISSESTGVSVAGWWGVVSWVSGAFWVFCASAGVVGDRGTSSMDGCTESGAVAAVVDNIQLGAPASSPKRTDLDFGRCLDGFFAVDEV